MLKLSAPKKQFWKFHNTRTTCICSKLTNNKLDSKIKLQVIYWFQIFIAHFLYIERVYFIQIMLVCTCMIWVIVTSIVVPRWLLFFFLFFLLGEFGFLGLFIWRDNLLDLRSTVMFLLDTWSLYIIHEWLLKMGERPKWGKPKQGHAKGF